MKNAKETIFFASWGELGVSRGKQIVGQKLGDLFRLLFNILSWSDPTSPQQKPSHTLCSYTSCLAIAADFNGPTLLST